MPEGDSIHRLAARINQRMLTEPIQRCWSGLPHIVDSDFLGRSILGAEARGKHLLIHVESAGIWHIHLGREGRYYFESASKTTAMTPRTNLVLSTESTLVFRCLPIFEHLSSRALMRHAHLQLLGPDLLGDVLVVDEVVGRFLRYPELEIGVAVMDQRICAGVGNIYKSEILFLEGIDPRRQVGRFQIEELQKLIERFRLWMRRNLGRGRRRTRWEPGPAHWVYGRSGEHCLRCGQTIDMYRQGSAGRSTYYCARCQTSASTGLA